MSCLFGNEGVVLIILLSKPQGQVSDKEFFISGKK